MPPDVGGYIFMEAPSTLTVGTKLTLTIDDIAFGGEGVGRVGEFVVFVPFVAVGETVEAEVIEVKKSFARAKLLQVTQLPLSASPHNANTSLHAAAANINISITQRNSR